MTDILTLVDELGYGSMESQMTEDVLDRLEAEFEHINPTEADMELDCEVDPAERNDCDAEPAEPEYDAEPDEKTDDNAEPAELEYDCGADSADPGEQENAGEEGEPTPADVYEPTEADVYDQTTTAPVSEANMTMVVCVLKENATAFEKMYFDKVYQFSYTGSVFEMEIPNGVIRMNVTYLVVDYDMISRCVWIAIQV